MQTLKDKIKLGGLRVQPPYSDRNVYPLGYLRPDGAIQIIGEINADGGTELETRSSADLIALAVNSHEDLLSACKILVEFADRNNRINLDGLLGRAVSEARAAVARVEAAPPPEPFSNSYTRTLDHLKNMTPPPAPSSDNLAQPEGLSEAGIAAWRAVCTLAKAEEHTNTGGDKAFYSPAQWATRGEEYGREAELIVCHDGGELPRYFNYDYCDYSAIERMNAALKAVGLWAEPCTAWYTAIYKLPGATPAPPVDPMNHLTAWPSL